MGGENRFQLHSHFDGVAAYLHVETVGEESVELQPRQTPFSHESAVHLDMGEEVFGCVSAGEDDCFAAEGTDFGSADIEYIAESGEVFKGDVGGRACEAVAEAGAVDVEGDVEVFADGMDLSKFRAGVDGAVFGRE